MGHAPAQSNDAALLPLQYDGFHQRSIARPRVLFHADDSFDYGGMPIPNILGLCYFPAQPHLDDAVELLSGLMGDDNLCKRNNFVLCAQETYKFPPYGNCRKTAVK